MSMESREMIRSLNEIGIALSAQNDLDTLLNLIVRQTRKLVRADAGSLYLVESKERGTDTEHLCFASAQCQSLEERLGGPLPFRKFILPISHESIAGHAALTGELINLEDCYLPPANAPYHINRHFDDQHGYHTQSMLVLPMKDNEGVVIGVLQLINALDEEGEIIPFSGDMIALAESIASQAAMAIRNTRLLKDIKDLFYDLMTYSVTAIEARSPHTAGHSRRVTTYALQIADAIHKSGEGVFSSTQIDEWTREELRCAGWLHDIGKIGIRESVLEKAEKLSPDQLRALEERWETIRLSILMRETDSSAQKKRLAELEDELDFIKRINIPGFLNNEDQARLKTIRGKNFLTSANESRPYITDAEFENLSVVKGSLTEAERLHIESHVEQTIHILGQIHFPRPLANVPSLAAAHHERLNGKGYPHNRKGEDISLPQRILAVADIYDALTASDRPYKKPIPPEKAFAILEKEAEAGGLDGEIVAVFKQSVLSPST